MIRYDGEPAPIDAFGESGFLPTDDGVLVAGEPHGAATWYPVNDHPLDKATYTFRIKVPQGLQAIANGELIDVKDLGRSTLWTWELDEPMASYLATASIGEFDIKSYEADGIAYWDAIDPDLLTRPAPRSGTRYALSGFAESSFKRLTRTIAVPSTGAKLSFWVTRNTEPSWDYFFVEAHTSGADDWTTLPDANGHTSKDTGFVCPFWFELHPFLAHYQKENQRGSCDPRGSTGRWNAATGASRGYERWVVDLTRYAGEEVEVALSYASDDFVQFDGVYIDDVVVTGAPGTTSFEEDGDPLDGWTIAGAPTGSAPNGNDWRTGTSVDAPPSVGEVAMSALERQPEILRFLSDLFGPYPWTSSGSIVDNVEIGFALENQTRVIYSPGFFEDRAEPTDYVVVHELAHQWVGDSLSVAAWQHVWLNEGFATYTEWLWDEHENRATADETFDNFAGIPADDPFWSLPIGDPGPKHLFDFPVYARGSMTLHALRTTIGDAAFFELLHEWVGRNIDGNVTTPEFIELAEEISDQPLDRFFHRWLFTPERPRGLGSIRDASQGSWGTVSQHVG